MSQSCIRHVKTWVPVEAEKSEGPTCRMPFLGITLDTVAMEMSLPADKLHHLREALAMWRGKKACTKRELQSLIGSLSHACKVVKPGRTFLRRLIDLSTLASKPHHFVRLNRDARSNIECWYRYAADWNRVSMLRNSTPCYGNPTVVSDASGRWGCGAFWAEKWFQLQWHDQLHDTHITVKELIPIVLAAAVWGPQWLGKTVHKIGQFSSRGNCQQWLLPRPSCNAPAKMPCIYQGKISTAHSGFARQWIK